MKKTLTQNTIFSILGLTNVWTIIAILIVLLIVPFQFEFYHYNKHVVEYYGYAFLFNPPKHSSVRFFTTQIIWSRVLIELIIVLLISFYFSNKTKTPNTNTSFSEIIYVIVNKSSNISLYLQTNNLIIKKAENEFIIDFTSMKINHLQQYKEISRLRVLPDSLEFQVLNYIKIDTETNKLLAKNNDPSPFSTYKLDSPVNQCVNFIINNIEIFTPK